MKERNFLEFKDFGGTATEKEVEAKLGIFNLADSFKNSKRITFPSLRSPETRRKYIEYTKEGFADPFKFATDNLLTFQKGFRVTRNIFFYEKLRDTLRRLFESGILQRFHAPAIDLFDDISNLEVHEKQSQYSTLTWEQLYPGFYIWLAALLVSFVVFISEIIVFRVLKFFSDEEV